MSGQLEPELERVAELLTQAGPLPDAPESLRERALAIPDGGTEADPVVPLVRRAGRRLRPSALAGLAAAVAVIAIVPAVAVIRSEDGNRQIELAPRPFAPQGGGSANVVARGDGSATIQLHVWKMPKPGQGRIYEAWLGKKGDRKPLGTFAIDPSGRATISYTLPSGELGGYRWLWVTSEPAGVSETPSDKTALWGPLT